MTKKKEDHLLNRRETLRMIGAAGATALLGGGAGQILGVSATGIPGSIAEASSLSQSKNGGADALDCVVRPALTEGPYFVDEKLNRFDIRSDPTTNAVKEGALLKLNLNVVQVGSHACIPIPGAQVDIWHCDALGVYSDIGVRAGGRPPGGGRPPNWGRPPDGRTPPEWGAAPDGRTPPGGGRPPGGRPPGGGPPPMGGGNPDTTGQKFLRGYQITDSNGSVQFMTIYPGYYAGRTVHIHFKIRLFAGSEKTFEFTSQFFFDDALTDKIFTLAPYNTKTARDTRNSNDGIYNEGGSQLLLNLTPDGDGYTTNFKIGVMDALNVSTPSNQPR